MELVFFSQHVDAALANGDLNGAAILIKAAEADKADGYGPPETEIIAAKRKWLDRYEAGAPIVRGADLSQAVEAAE